jgi:hypothetical protein
MLNKSLEALLRGYVYFRNLGWDEKSCGMNGLE